MKRADKLYIEYKENIMKVEHPEEYEMLSKSYLENSKERINYEGKSNNHYYSVGEVEDEVAFAGEQLDWQIEVRDDIAELRLRRDSRYMCYRRHRKEK